MNLSAARLALLGSRSSLGRLLGIGAGVALGVAAFLLLWGAGDGLADRVHRTGWLYTWGVEGPRPLTQGESLWALTTDYHEGDAIVRRDIAAGPGATATVPGVGALPEPGAYYASQAFADLVAKTPPAELGDRYGVFAGTLPPSVLSGPDALVVVKGSEPDAVARLDTANVITDLQEDAAQSSSSYRTIMLIGGIAVFFPVLLLVGIATSLGAAARAESFATLRLIGATPGALARLAAWEMGAVALAGGVLGTLLAWALRPVAALVPLGDGRLYAADLAVSPVTAALTVVAVAVIAAGAAAWRIHRTGVGPLGATRQRRERVPTAWRALPLVGGLAAMAAATLWTDALPDSAIQPLLLGGFGLTTAGIAIVGPWLTLCAGRLLERRARGAAGVIAGGRVRATPSATFRSVSGMVVAVFTVSVFAGAASSVDRITTPDTGPGLSPLNSVFAYIPDGAATPEALRAAASGAQRLVVAYGPPERDFVAVSAADARALGLPVPDGARFVRFNPMPFTEAAPEEPATTEPTPGLRGLDPAMAFALTDGTQTGQELARTALDTSGLTAGPALSRADLADLGLRGTIGNLAKLAYLGVFVAILIAGVSLAVSTAAAMLDRRRVLGLMRLMGMAPKVLRRVIAYETAVPLASVVLLSAAAGFGVAWLILEGLGKKEGLTMGAPDPVFFLTLGVGLALTAAATAAAASLVTGRTGLATTRFE
ncbi:FtsX-like permease family protein [Actinocorallia sp. A-T 12471]|uniref:FtsX-like permease family protein n=1 Tax=Actinocorallia sp. A-T 12471 TaxID=3089813 RepID=UPI0029D32D66|nr:FtsX-like permease family protein [Actinocorallia sp. A-T 12471]MDX6739137.1 FtsX-like permease family protein [Actinocorallia sp. A-T 12471]